MANFGAIRSDVYDRVSRSQYYRDNLAGLTAHQRHQRLLAELPEGAGNLQQQADAAAAQLQSTISDEDVLRAHHRFLRTAEDDAGEQSASWGARLARSYYARLFKEYAIADLSRYKESKIGMRWRTKQEVVSGKGQLSCGARGCDEAARLSSYEVNFAYAEAGQQKQALVKLRLCDACADKLQYKQRKQYRKLGLSVLEQHEQQQQQRRYEEEERHHKRKHKHRHNHRDDKDSPAAQEEQQERLESQLAERSGKGGSKRQRYNGVDECAGAAAPAADAAQRDSYGRRWDGHEQQQQQRGCDVGAKVDEVLTDVDIDQFLDDVFAN